MSQATAEERQQLKMLMDVSAAAWAAYSLIKLGGNTFSFKDHEYQVEPMNVLHRRVCYMKGTGGGFSQLEILKTLHGLIKKRFPQGALYLFPTGDDVSEYSKSRFGPLVGDNPLTIGKFVRSTDMATLKQIGDAFLYLRGARLSQSVGDSGLKESSRLAGIQVDRIVADEPDKMDIESISKARGRMGHSLIKEEAWISNPTDEDYGIDIPWQLSDQRHWFRMCSCGTRTCAEEEFPNCIEKDSAGKGYVACKKCGKALAVGAPGSQWVAKYPDRSVEWAGYRWSHLTSVYNDPYEVLQQYSNPPEGNLGDIYRLRLGLPYSSREEKLRKETVLACCGPDGPMLHHQGPCAMGVDNDDSKHVVIGIRTGEDRFQVLWTGKLADSTAVYDMIHRFHVKSIIMDLRPNAESARAFAKAARAAGCRTLLAEYTDSILQDAFINDDTGIIKIYRTGVFDLTHRAFTENQITIPRQCSATDEYAIQCCNCVKAKDTNAKGQVVYRYKKTGNGHDHLRNATNYFVLAARRIAKAAARGHASHRATKTDNEYVRC